MIMDSPGYPKVVVDAGFGVADIILDERARQIPRMGRRQGQVPGSGRRGNAYD
jgi:hypothetical protein